MDYAADDACHVFTVFLFGFFESLGEAGFDVQEGFLGFLPFIGRDVHCYLEKYRSSLASRVKFCHELTMNARERVEDLYHIYPQPRTFEQDVALHRLNGVVIEREDFFLMARGVKHDAGHEALSNPEVSFAREVQDCWLIYAYSGPLEVLVTVAPYYLPFICWARRKGRRWHVYPMNRWCKRLLGLSPTWNKLR
jgi:hypothetical protein